MHRRVLVVVVSALAVLLAWAAPAEAITHGQPDNGAHPYVGELLFFVPDETDSRFDDPGSWFTCSGTLLNDHVVLTAGHCTYATGRGGVSTTANGGSGSGGTDVWISFSESPDFSILPPSSSYGRDQNAQRYHDWSTALNASADWHQATAFPHPQFDPDAFFLHDAGVLQLQEPAPMSRYGALPQQGFLDQFQTARRAGQTFTVVGYGLNKVRSRTSRSAATPGSSARCSSSPSTACSGSRTAPPRGSPTTTGPCTRAAPASATPADRRSSTGPTSSSR